MDNSQHEDFLSAYTNAFGLKENLITTLVISTIPTMQDDYIYRYVTVNKNQTPKRPLKKSFSCHSTNSSVLLQRDCFLSGDSYKTFQNFTAERRKRSYTLPIKPSTGNTSGCLSFKNKRWDSLMSNTYSNDLEAISELSTASMENLTGEKTEAVSEKEILIESGQSDQSFQKVIT
ncbi:uncharacterized protein LOC130635440 [Hydractinia symbiolongicarpus]|uniref:uncharacterized protein LOC130635440 n=1 Tax=Hydractinia symbiolongicarpus TaxID=13093 RepID=UPI00254F2B4F|nr:uncharacterized protein LOC130635440 [Hydractinia symbiolongicarpus]